MQNNILKMPPKNEFKTLKEAISSAFKDFKGYDIPKNKEEIVYDSLYSYFSAMTKLKSTYLSEKLVHLSAYQWLTQARNKNCFEQAIACVDKNAIKKNFVDFHTRKAMKKAGINPREEKQPKLKFSQITNHLTNHSERENKLNRYAKEFHNVLWGREKIIFHIVDCLMDFEGNKVTKMSDVDKKVMAVLKALQKAKKACEELEPYEDMMLIGNKEAASHIDYAIDILGSNKPDYQIQRVSLQAIYRRFVIRVTKYFLDNGGISINKSDETPTVVLLKKKTEGLNDDERIVNFPLNKWPEFKKLIKEEGLLVEFRSELNTWLNESDLADVVDCTDNNVFKIDASTFKEQLDDLAFTQERKDRLLTLWNKAKSAYGEHNTVEIVILDDESEFIRVGNVKKKNSSHVVTSEYVYDIEDIIGFLKNLYEFDMFKEFDFDKEIIRKTIQYEIFKHVIETELTQRYLSSNHMQSSSKDAIFVVI